MTGINWTEKEWKQFNRLSKEDKQRVMEVMIARAVNDALNKHITDYTITGCLIEAKNLYERHVKAIDAMTVNSFKWAEAVQALLSDIRTDYAKYRKKYAGVLVPQESESEPDGKQD